MTATVHELRPKMPESEKITINLGYVDLLGTAMQHDDKR
jgi:hypothetical protein